MKNILLGIAAGTLIPPVSGVLLGLFLWSIRSLYNLQYTFYQALTLGFIFGLVGIVYSAVILLLYGLPIYLFLRALGWANRYTCLATALLPWILLGILTHDIGFLMPAWFALVSSGCFWWFARREV